MQIQTYAEISKINGNFNFFRNRMVETLGSLASAYKFTTAPRNRQKSKKQLGSVNWAMAQPFDSWAPPDPEDEKAIRRIKAPYIGGTAALHA